MIDEKLKSIEDRIQNSISMNAENKEAVLQLLSELKSEIQEVSNETTDKIAGQLEDSHEHDGLIKQAFNEVSDTVKEFEENHPKLVQVVNSICTQLSNAGL